MLIILENQVWDMWEFTTLSLQLFSKPATILKSNIKVTAHLS